MGHSKRFFMEYLKTWRSERDYNLFSPCCRNSFPQGNETWDKFQRGTSWTFCTTYRDGKIQKIFTAWFSWWLQNCLVCGKVTLVMIKLDRSARHIWKIGWKRKDESVSRVTRPFNANKWELSLMNYLLPIWLCRNGANGNFRRMFEHRTGL